MKVGDFGLSRESYSVGSISAFDDCGDKNGTDLTAVDPPKGMHHTFRGCDAENTAGVGTQAVSHQIIYVFTPSTNM